MKNEAQKALDRAYNDILTLLNAITWEPLDDDDSTLEINRDVAEKIYMQFHPKGKALRMGQKPLDEV